MQEINFKKLIKSYDQNLLDNLRGFGKDDEYLKFWVPGTNDYQSFLNLVDALAETKLLNFKINFDYNNDEIKLVDQIGAFLNKISNYKKIKNNNSIIFEVELIRKKYEDFIFSRKNKIKDNKSNNIDKTKEVLAIRVDENIKSFYKKKLDLIVCKNFFSEKEFGNIEDYYIDQIGSAKIAICIKKQIIKGTYHNITEQSDFKKLINIFFEIILNKNIQEAADHGAIYLEEKIRGYNQIRYDKGIILPDQAGSYFTLIKKTIRNIFLNYQIKTKTKFDVNKNYYKTSEDWKKLDYDKKLLKINSILNEIYIDFNELSNENLSINKIENNFKIFLNVDKKFTKIQERVNLLLYLEIKLKKIDNSLEVFIEEILDKNKLRLKNSPQNIA